MSPQEFKQQFDELVNSAAKIYITSHERPDDDAVSSALATYYYVKDNLGKQARLILTGEPTDSWEDRDKEGILEWTPDFNAVANEADLVIFLDGSELSRFGKSADKFDATKSKTICIDHHPGDAFSFDLILQDTTAVAASQMVYELLYSDSDVPANVAEMLMFGIMGDTGNFRFVDHTRSRVFGVAEKLVNAGELNIQTMSDSMSEIAMGTFEAVKILIDNTTNTEIPGVPPLSYSYISHVDLEKLDAASAKSAVGFYMFSFLRKIEGHKWGFVVRAESVTKYNISFRSSPEVVNVRELAMKFNGGGHVLAAGGEFTSETDTTTEAVCQKVLDTILEMKEQILN